MAFVSPCVTLLASTKVHEDFENMPRQAGQTDAEYLIEFAGRECYASQHRPRMETADYRDYIERTVFERGHGSITEHTTATLYFTGVSRSFLAELSRHRHLSFSVRSQRFVDESNPLYILPPNVTWGSAEFNLLSDFQIIVEEYYDGVVLGLDEEDNLKRKQVREAARAVLPNMVETRMVVTGNMRAWMEVVERRTAPDADAEMQEVMKQARKQLAKVAPTLFRGR